MGKQPQGQEQTAEGWPSPKHTQCEKQTCVPSASTSFKDRKPTINLPALIYPHLFAGPQHSNFYLLILPRLFFSPFTATGFQSVARSRKKAVGLEASPPLPSPGKIL